jgi:hypothetical protein
MIRSLLQLVMGKIIHDTEERSPQGMAWPGTMTM